MQLRDLLPVFREALALLGPHCVYASVYARRGGGTRIRCDNQGCLPTPVPSSTGFTLTAWRGGRVYEFSRDDTRSLEVTDAARQLAKRLAAVGGPVDGPGPQVEAEADRHFAQSMDEDSRQVPVATKVACARELREHMLGRGDRLAEVLTMVGDVHSDIMFVDTTRVLSQELHRVQQVVLSVHAEGRDQARMHDGFERIGGWEHMGLDPGRWDELVRDGTRILGAGRIPDPGRHACVFSPAFAGIFAHEAFGHGTEQDLFLKHRARGADYLGEMVASPLVDMWDDPSKGWAASYFFDDEGVIAGPTRIVEKGRLVAGLNDQYSAAHLGEEGMEVAKTANGRREAYDHKVYARMSNTFFGPGEHAFADLIGSVEHGYYLHHPSNGMEDPQGWGIQLEGAYCERIANGSLTGEVYSPVVVTGSVPDLLQSVCMVGSAVEECSLGMCGKGHKEYVKVTDGGPALRLEAVLA